MLNVDRFLAKDEQRNNFDDLRERDEFTVPPTNTVILSNQEIDDENEETVLIGSTVDHEYPENEDEMPQPPRKRRVVGIMRKKYRQVTHEPMQQSPESFVAGPPIPTPQQYMAEFQQQQRYYPHPQQQNQQQQRINVEQNVRDQVRADLLYQIEMDKAQRRAAQAPRMTTSQKCLSVAMRAAYGDGAGSQLNIKTCLFKKPRVDLPAKNIKLNSINNLNQTIKNIAPKITKKKKGSFF